MEPEQSKMATRVSLYRPEEEDPNESTDLANLEELARKLRAACVGLRGTTRSPQWLQDHIAYMREWHRNPNSPPLPPKIPHLDSVAPYTKPWLKYSTVYEEGLQVRMSDTFQETPVVETHSTKIAEISTAPTDSATAVTTFIHSTPASLWGVDIFEETSELGQSSWTQPWWKWSEHYKKAYYEGRIKFGPVPNQSSSLQPFFASQQSSDPEQGSMTPSSSSSPQTFGAQQCSSQQSSSSSQTMSDTPPSSSSAQSPLALFDLPGQENAQDQEASETPQSQSEEGPRENTQDGEPRSHQEEPENRQRITRKKKWTIEQRERKAKTKQTKEESQNQGAAGLSQSRTDEEIPEHDQEDESENEEVQSDGEPASKDNSDPPAHNFAHQKESKKKKKKKKKRQRKAGVQDQDSREIFQAHSGGEIPQSQQCSLANPEEIVWVEWNDDPPEKWKSLIDNNRQFRNYILQSTRIVDYFVIIGSPNPLGGVCYIFCAPLVLSALLYDHRRFLYSPSNQRLSELRQLTETPLQLLNPYWHFFDFISDKYAYVIKDARTWSCEVCQEQATWTSYQPHWNWVGQQSGRPELFAACFPLCDRELCYEVIQSIRTHYVSEGLAAKNQQVFGRWKGKECATCKDTKNLLFCAECKMQAYCSKKCQRADWRAHRPGCIEYTFNRDREDPIDAVAEIFAREEAAAVLLSLAKGDQRRNSQDAAGEEVEKENEDIEARG